MVLRLRSAIILLGGLAGALPAAAAIQTDKVNADISSKPHTYDFGNGNTITFSTVDPSSFAYNPDGVSTTGTTQVGSFGEPFYNPPQPTSYFTNRGGSFGPGPGGEFPQFLSYSSPATVAYSISESLVGFRFDAGNGYQYGYADIAGSTFHGVRFETTPGANVAFAAVPEPAAWAFMLVGFGVVGGAARRRRMVAA